jgi:hypothetical protein
MSATSMRIDVGPLSGLTSFCIHAAGSMQEFNRRWEQGNPPHVIWDLTRIRPPHINLFALTAFLATAWRLRQFVGKDMPSAALRWNPLALAFLENVQFIEIATREGLFRLEEGFDGAGAVQRPSRESVLLFFEYQEPPSRNAPGERNDWKDRYRQFVTADLSRRTSRFFRPLGGRKLDPRLQEDVTLACAELVVNASLWGKSPAFVGLQRSRVGITVAVSDGGPGFFSTVRDRAMQAKRHLPRSHAEALVVGSLITTREIGLRRVIETVISSGGFVQMSSYDAELRWRRRLWWETVTPDSDGYDALQVIGSPIHGRIPQEARDRGYLAEYDLGLRGARVSFEVPAFPV